MFPYCINISQPFVIFYVYNNSKKNQFVFDVFTKKILIFVTTKINFTYNIIQPECLI